MQELEIRTDDIVTAPDPQLVPTTPLVGNALQMAKDPGTFFIEMYQKYGPIFRIKILNKTYLHVPSQQRIFALKGVLAGHG